MTVEKYIVKNNSNEQNAVDPLGGSCVSYVYTDENGAERVAYSGLPLREFLATGNYKAIDSAEYCSRLDFWKKWKIDKEQVEISEVDWWWSLESLPPCRWTTFNGIEIFHTSEVLVLDLVTWFGRIGNRYFKLVDCSDQPPNVIAGRTIKLKARH